MNKMIKTFFLDGLLLRSAKMPSLQTQSGAPRSRERLKSRPPDRRAFPDQTVPRHTERPV